MPAFTNNSVGPSVLQVTARVHGRREEDMSSVVAVGPAEPAVPGQDAGSGHTGSLRLEPECSENAKAPSNGCMWQVGQQGLVLSARALVSHWCCLEWYLTPFLQWGN